MKILLLADIHGNLPALNAVFENSEALGCDAVWCLGDIVGYGPYPNECARLIRDKADCVIRGNHDIKAMADYPQGKPGAGKKEDYKIFVFKWTHGVLAPDVQEYLSGLSTQMRLEIDGRKVLLVHGSPEGVRDGLTPYTSDARLRELAAAAAADLILVGHTHDTFAREAGGSLFINPGSVGRPFDTDPRASFMTLDISQDGLRTEAHRIAYDMTGVVREMKKQGFPDVLITAFMEARSPSDVLPVDVKGDLAFEALQMGERYACEKPHARQVARLALRLFDALSTLHGYGLRERALVQAGALLHDVGIARGAEEHHKSSRDMILEDTTLPVSERERMVVALIARYHRRSLPRPGHKYFAELPDHHKLLVERLGGMVRLADGLDRSHQGLVKDIGVDVLADTLHVRLEAVRPVEEEIEFGKVKSDLLARALGKKLVIEGS